jgi:guanylate kinase
MLHEEIKGQLVLLMGPTGSGKGTLTRHVKKVFPELQVTISCTTRAKRPGEEDGREYHFLTPEAFDEHISNGDFLEWATFGKNNYGTLKQEILPHLDTCHVVLTEIEIQGVEQLIALIPREQITIVYIEAGGWDNLKSRALARAHMSEDELEARYQRFLIEEEAKPIADTIIDNSVQDFTSAKDTFAAVIKEAYQKCT